MDALKSFADALGLGPWPIAILVSIAIVIGAIYRFYMNTLSERGPASRRIRQNLERERPRLRDYYYYVLISLRRTIDELCGPTGSATARINSLQFFIKVSTVYSFGTLLFVYLISGNSPTVFNIFANSLSHNERAAMMICSVLGLAIGSSAYLASLHPKGNVLSIASAIFLSLTPFILAHSYGMILGYDVFSNSISYWVYAIFFASFVGQLFTAFDRSGFVAVTVAISFIIALVFQLVAIGIIFLWLDIKPEELGKPESMFKINSWLFSILTPIALLVTYFFPFGMRLVAERFEDVAVRNYGKGKFYICFLAIASLAFIFSCVSPLTSPAISLLLLPTLALPIISVVLDWASFQAADKMLTLSVQAGGKYAIISAVASIAIASVSAALFILLFLLTANLATTHALGKDGFKFVDPQLSIELLQKNPSDPRLWWLYALMAFNVVPLLVNLATAAFGLLSWKTPKWATKRYSSYIRTGFKGDYPRLAETSAFLTLRLILSICLSGLALLASGWILAFLLPNGSPIIFKFLEIVIGSDFHN